MQGTATNHHEMALFETIYILYSPPLAQKLRQLLTKIQSKYANFRYFHYKQQLSKQLEVQYHQIKLTKRKKVFAIMTPLPMLNNPQIIPQGSRKITFINYEEELDEDVYFIGEETDWTEIEVQLVKIFQLDSVWLGLLYRIGTDIVGLHQHLVEFQHFEEFQVSFLSHFYQRLQIQLQQGRELHLDLLQLCRKQVEQHLKEYNSRVEDLVRSNFNRRMVITDVTMHPYINLLQSRSYFNLIYIEGQILNRFETFKRNISKGHPMIEKILSLENFILLDDYIYSSFIFGCLKKVRKYINRTLSREPYANIVKTYHKDFIRQFRPSFHEYFLNICLVLKQRAACLKEAVGSIIVKDRNIISTGYNGTPMGTINCYNGGCHICNNSQKMSTEVLSCRCLHAQYNCILTAGITATPGATLYSSKLPCLWCAKLIIQGSIREVIYVKSKYEPLEHQNYQLVKRTFEAGKVVLREMTLSFYD